MLIQTTQYIIPLKKQITKAYELVNEQTSSINFDETTINSTTDNRSYSMCDCCEVELTPVDDVIEIYCNSEHILCSQCYNRWMCQISKHFNSNLTQSEIRSQYGLCPMCDSIVVDHVIDEERVQFQMQCILDITTKVNDGGNEHTNGTNSVTSHTSSNNMSICNSSSQSFVYNEDRNERNDVLIEMPVNVKKSMMRDMPSVFHEQNGSCYGSETQSTVNTSFEIVTKD